MPKLEDDIDALFQLPLDKFIEARKLLAAQLKKAGQRVEAERVKLLSKPPISAWTVNQLYWNHREPFDELMASGQRFRKAQASGKIAEMRDALNARTEALKELSDLATDLLGDADHTASLDTIRRVTSTLEAVSAYALLPDAALGRLTKDIDPPGFESSFTGTAFGTASVSPATSKSKVQSPKTKAPSPESKSETLQKDAGEKVRQAKLSAAKVSLQSARKSLALAQAKAQSLESQQKKADAALKEAEKEQREAEKERREAEVRLKRATSAAEAATRRAQTIRDEMAAAKETLDDAQRAVAKSTKELESLFRSTR